MSVSLFILHPDEMTGRFCPYWEKPAVFAKFLPFCVIYFTIFFFFMIIMSI
ncbi:hypothetical protein HMPREF3213_01005 [Heyndrickxia coagulans]|uniref:Uncharacterized protein n=1 Tax=Heyndrickxia coagulans TaxID=1398 RepID=A0A0C5CM53_HEYCO|nr:hypothetical protein SB48_HM08orf02624 [Heyndrickxia coagulans]KWZ83947.1 hypothetical protein HMPREF3213_01005 [Heyndrickxia coagulans]